MQRHNMTPLAQTIYDGVVRPSIISRPIGGRGVIVDYDYLTRKATVKMKDSYTGTSLLVNNVPVGGLARLNEGVKDGVLHAGDVVWVAYLNDTYPIIVSVLPPETPKDKIYYNRIGHQIPDYLDFKG